MWERLFNWLVPREALRFEADPSELVETREWAMAAQTRADRGDVTDTTSFMRERLTTLSAVQPEHGFIDPNCYHHRTAG